MTLKPALTLTLVATLVSACASLKSDGTSIVADQNAGIDLTTESPAENGTENGTENVANANANAESDTQPPTALITRVGASKATEFDALIEDDQVDLVASLPASIESFELAGARTFDEEGDGVNVRYANPKKRRRADVFIYPVAEPNRSLAHPDLVLGSTQATVRAITEAVQAGLYQNLNVIDAATKANGLRTIARVQATYLRENLASYTLVYQTEHDGTMVKIRLTMPDNEHNRSSREWDRFADTVLNSVTGYLDVENQAEPAAAAEADPVDTESRNAASEKATS